jgi:hypothetical protein
MMFVPTTPPSLAERHRHEDTSNVDNPTSTRNRDKAPPCAVVLTMFFDAFENYWGKMRGDGLNERIIKISTTLSSVHKELSALISSAPNKYLVFQTNEKRIVHTRVFVLLV